MRKTIDASLGTGASSPGIRTYIRQIGLVGVAQQLLALRGLITLPLYTKALGAEQYGILALLITGSGLLVEFVLMRLPSGLIRILPGERDRSKIAASFISAALVNVVLGLLLFGLGSQIRTWLATSLLHQPTAAPYVQLLLMSLVPTALKETLMSYYRVTGRIGRYVALDVVFSVLEISATWFIVMKGFGVFGIVAVMMARNAFLSLIAMVDIVRENGWTRPNARILVPYFTFCLPLLLPNLMSWVSTLGDRFILAYMVTSESVGVYHAAYQLPQFILTLNTAILFVFEPVWARVWRDGDVGATQYYMKRALETYLVIALPMTTGTLMLAKPLMTILTSQQIAARSYEVIVLLAITNIIRGICAFPSSIFLVRLNPWISVYMSVLTAALNMGLNFALIPHYGITGAASATFVSFSLTAIATAYLGHRELRLVIDWGLIRRVAMVDLTMFFFLLLAGGAAQTWWQLLFIVSGASLLYGTGLLVSGVIRLKQLRAFLGR